MLYKVCLSHIHPDYSVEPPPTETWSAVVETDEDLVILLNRVAIVSSQNLSHEYPVLDVVAGSIRATITVIGGQLYYTDPNAPNRSNIKVVADGALQLLHGSSFESVLQAEAAMQNETAAAGRVYRRAGLGPRARAILLVVLLVLFGSSMTVIWKQLSYRPRLVPVHEFVPGAIAEERIRAYSGIYWEGHKEGGTVLELTSEGLFKLYRMWRTADHAGYSLRQVESLPLRLGSQGGQPALMAGNFYLLLPRSEGRILMGGVRYHRHFGTLGEIGELQPLK